MGAPCRGRPRGLADLDVTAKRREPVSRLGGHRWPHERLSRALRLIRFLPTTPGVTIAEMIEHLDIARSQVYDLLAVLRDAGIEVQSMYRTDGSKAFYLYPADKLVVDKLIGG